MDCNNGVGLAGWIVARELATNHAGLELVEAFGRRAGNLEIFLGGGQLNAKKYRPFPAYIPADGQAC